MVPYEYGLTYGCGLDVETNLHIPNLYLDGMRKNVSYVAAGPAPALRRRPPYTLLPEVQPYPRDLFGV